MRTVADLKDGVSGLLTGLNLDNVTSLERALERGFRNFVQKAAIPEASTSSIFPLYDGVYNYATPPSLFGGAIRDLRPIGVSRTENDYVYRQPIEQFDRTKALLPNGYAVTFETENGVNLMRIAQVKAIPHILLDPMTATTGWTASGSATNLVTDSSFFYQTPSSLRFLLTGASTGYLTKTLTSGLDLTAYRGVGVVFLALQIPSTALSSVEIRLGSDASNYYSLTVTQGFIGAWSTGDFLMTAFDLSLATTVGTPVITNMKYVRLGFLTTGTMTNVRVGNLFIALPSQHKLFFETTAIFKNQATGVISNIIGSNTDLVLLNDAGYNIFEIEAAIAVGQQSGTSAGTLGGLTSLLNGSRARNGAVLTLGLYDIYRSDNPSEEINAVGSYYDAG